MSHPSTPRTRSLLSTRRRAAGITAACAALALGAGCENAGQGAVSGAAIGALSGLAIGSITGDAGTGAAIGAIAGGVGGAVIGDQNERKNNQQANNDTPREVHPAVAEADRDRVSLTQFVGQWDVSAWSADLTGDRRDVTGTVTGEVEQAYFLRLDASLTVDAETNRRRSGTLLFGSEPGRGVTLSSRFDDAPSTSRFVGSASADGRSFTLEEINPIEPAVRRRVDIRILSNSEWIMDVTNLAESGSPRLGSFRFTRK